MAVMGKVGFNGQESLSLGVNLNGERGFKVVDVVV